MKRVLPVLLDLASKMVNTKATVLESFLKHSGTMLLGLANFVLSSMGATLSNVIFALSTGQMRLSMGIGIVIHGGLAATVMMGVIPSAMAAEPNLAIPDAANFLDAGLTALGLLTALVTTILRRRLDAENNTRDFLTYLVGQRDKTVKVLDVYGQHSLSRALLLVEENSQTWAQQLFSYYGATTGKPITLMSTKWLHPNYPANVEECTCRDTKCRCLLLERFDGDVTKHLVTIAPGVISRIDDTYDAILCVNCQLRKCHGSANNVYQSIVGGRLGLGASGATNLSSLALYKSVSSICGEHYETGLILVEPANDESTTWSSTILEASSVKDADDRGNENPFTHVYKKVIAGESISGAPIAETQYNVSSWWLSRVCAFTITCALVFLFRTDSFSSVLLARRALRGYVVDSTQTKLPLSDFCSSAECLPGEEGLALVILKPRKGKYSLPSQTLLFATALEAFVLPLWLACISITPWFRPIGSSYLNDPPLWATALGCSVVLLASSTNVGFYWKQGSKEEKLRWAILTSICAWLDASVMCLSILGWAKVVQGHWPGTALRAGMMLGAVMQWILGVDYLPSITVSFHHQEVSTIVPYALTYLRLLALVAGGGKWA